MEWLTMNGVPFCIIFTKADKLKPTEIDTYVNRYFAHMLEGNWSEVPQHFVTSSSKYIGKEEVLGFIDQLNQTV